MRSTLLRYAVALLTFSIGVAVASVWLLGHREREPVKASPPPSSNSTSLSTPTPATTPFDFDEYYGYVREASVKCEDFSSPAGADRALSARVEDDGVAPAEVVERGAKTDGAGLTVGRRVVTWSCCGVEGQSAAHVYWTDGARFCDIIAATVEGALEFEGKNR